MNDQNALTSEQYWSRHNVTNHKSFETREESLEYFGWRNDQYPGYIELMPVSGLDDKVVLDYGCGPGNDLVGFSEFSRTRALFAADVSQPSLDEAMRRVSLHGGKVTPLKLSEVACTIPLDDASVDYVHCSGVLMLVTDPVAVLREFRRVLRPDGRARLMVYNYDSVWLHLYVAYLLMEEDASYRGMTLKEAFDRSTDGVDCPINRCWTAGEICEISRKAGLEAKHLGNAISVWEMGLLGRRFSAIMSPTLAAEHRRFLCDLTFDHRGWPYSAGQVAGIDACFELRRT